MASDLTKPKISIIMSVYNGEQFLEECISSILDQTYEQWEFIIINDGSNDNTNQILNSYSDNRIKVFHNKYNLGLTKSLNKVINLSKGDYIARMDADDIALPNRLEEQLKFLENNHEFSFVGSLADFIDEKNQIISTFTRETDFNKISGSIFYKNQFIHSSILIKKKDLLFVGGYDEEFEKSQDFRLWQQLFYNNRFGTNIPKVLIKYRLHKRSITSTKNKIQDYYACRVVKKGMMQYFSIRFSLISIKNIRDVLVYHKSSKNLIYFINLFLLRLLYIKMNTFLQNPEALSIFRQHINRYIASFPIKTLQTFIFRLFYFKMLNTN